MSAGKERVEDEKKKGLLRRRGGEDVSAGFFRIHSPLVLQ